MQHGLLDDPFTRFNTVPVTVTNGQTQAELPYQYRALRRCLALTRDKNVRKRQKRFFSLHIGQRCRDPRLLPFRVAMCRLVQK